MKIVKICRNYLEIYNVSDYFFLSVLRNDRSLFGVDWINHKILICAQALFLCNVVWVIYSKDMRKFA